MSKNLNDLLKEVYEEDPRIILTHGKALFHAYRNAGRSFLEHNTLVPLMSFRTPELYEKHVKRYSERKHEYQEAAFREQLARIRRALG